MINLHLRALAVSASLLLLVGCSSSEPMAVVTGVVSVGSTPVGPSSVQFHPSEGGRPIATSTEEGGKYRVTLPPGDYKVVVRTSYRPPEGWKEGDPLPQPPVAIPKVYTLRTSTTLQVAVDKPEDITKDLQL